MDGTSWDDEVDVLEDISAAVDAIRADSGYKPDRFVFTLKDYAYCALGYLVERITDNLEAVLNYELPQFTLKDHLRDCFGFKRPVFKYDMYEYQKEIIWDLFNCTSITKVVDRPARMIDLTIDFDGGDDE